MTPELINEKVQEVNNLILKELDETHRLKVSDGLFSFHDFYSYKLYLTILLFNEWEKQSNFFVYKARYYSNSEPFTPTNKFVVVANLPEDLLYYDFFPINTWSLFLIPEKPVLDNIDNIKNYPKDGVKTLHYLCTHFLKVKENYQAQKVKSREEKTFTFSEMIDPLSKGYKIARKSWFNLKPKGKMLVYFVSNNQTNEKNFYFYNDGHVDIYWKPSAEEVLASDWIIVN